VWPSKLNGNLLLKLALATLNRWVRSLLPARQMPVLVSVRMMSGEMLECCLPGFYTVKDLKVALFQRAGIKPSRLRLVTPAGRLCAEEDGLLEVWGGPLEEEGFEESAAGTYAACDCLQ